MLAKPIKVIQKHLKMPFFSLSYETLKSQMEKETPDEMEMAEKTPKKRKKKKKTA